MDHGVIFQLERPGVVGVSSLARTLNDLKTRGNIHDWHPGRWKNGRAQTRIEIVFDDDHDAQCAQEALQQH